MKFSWKLTFFTEYRNNFFLRENEDLTYPVHLSIIERGQRINRIFRKSSSGVLKLLHTVLLLTCYKLTKYTFLLSTLSLRAGSLVPRTGKARKSEPARELLIFEFRPSQGVKSAFHMCQII